MKKLSYAVLLITLFCNLYNATSQSTNKLGNPQTFQEYEKSIKIHKQDTALALKYAQEWLVFAKAQKKPEQQLKAYQHLMHLVEKKFRLIYADSLLMVAQASKNKTLMGSAHLTIGAAYYNERELNKALDQYLMAYDYISKTEDKYLQHKLKYTLAQTKYHLGFYEEAMVLFSECLVFFKENKNRMGYVKTLHALALCYNHMGRYDLCSYNNQLGMELAEQSEMLDMVPYFKNSEGINQYKLKNGNEAMDLLLESLLVLETNKDVPNQIVTWFYLGKSYWEVNKKQQAMAYFTKITEAIETNKFVHPDIRETYELVLTYHVMNKDFKEQLNTIEKLMQYDTQLHHDFKYLSTRIHKEYDTKRLLQKKQEIEDDLAWNKIKSISMIGLLSVCVLGLLTYHLCNKKIQKQKFDQIMNKMASKKKVEVNLGNPIENISPEVTKVVLKNLEKFETTNKFTEKEINLTKLATLLNTNTKYASLIIAHYRGKKTTTYINDLKIDFVVNLMINNNKFRNYTNKALAEEAGFGSTQIFTQCFKTKIGMSPTAFSQQLKSAKDNNL